MSGGSRKLVAALALFGLAAVTQPACQGDYFGKSQGGSRLVVELVDGDKVAASRIKPRKLRVNTPETFKVKIRAIDQHGNIDKSYNGFVRLSSKPGAIDRLTAPDADGRNLKLKDGESDEVEVQVSNAYGSTYILAEDLGYAPADPSAMPPPACSDGLDNDGDGRVDFPTDEGCAFANDNTEQGGTFAVGSTQPIYYALPRIADLRGLLCDESGVCNGTGKTPYPREQLFIDTGLHDKSDGSQNYDFDMVVTRIASDGFYVADTKDKRGGYTGIFAFNFSAPPRMRVCDRLKTFTGTAAEFFGQTQIGYPTWTLEAWNPELRPCLVPEPVDLKPDGVLADFDGDGRIDVPAGLPGAVGSLVRVMTNPQEKIVVRVTSNFGPGIVPKDDKTKAYTFSPDASNCDFNSDGRIDFAPGADEGACASACQLNPDCTEYSNFAGRSTFRLFVSDGNVSGAIQADATVSAEFKPLEHKGQPIKSFTGVMSFFSGGSQYTIEARCPDDIVVDVNAAPLPSDKACVLPRTDLDENPQ